MTDDSDLVTALGTDEGGENSGSGDSSPVSDASMGADHRILAPPRNLGNDSAKRGKKLGLGAVGQLPAEREAETDGSSPVRRGRSLSRKPIGSRSNIFCLTHSQSFYFATFTFVLFHFCLPLNIYITDCLI